MDSQRTLSGRYRLVAHLARGGMADVFQAEDTLLQRRVAVKVLHPQYANNQAFVHRFRREAQAAANLNHPNIVSIYDWGRDDRTYFMVMELIEGRTLRDVLRTEGQLLPRRAIEIVAEAAAALSIAHAAGITHRDVKPGNIMLTPDGSVKVTDFGIARAFDDSDELTRTGAVIGTATYFSPEQAQGLQIDHRSDLYSLGVVLYELLAGRPPFVGDSPVAMAYQHVSEFAPPPSSINPDVTPDLDAVVMKAMEKDPARRYESAGAMRDDLLRLLAGAAPAAAASLASAATQMMAAPPATVPPDETARHVAYVGDDEGRPSSQATFIFGIIGLVAAIAIGAFLLIRLLSTPASADTVIVPDVREMEAPVASTILQEQNLRVRERPATSDTIAAGFVIDTDPPPGTEVEADSFIDMFVSTGPVAFPVPRLEGETEQQALALIEENGFVRGEITYEPHPTVPDGVVLAQDPPAGELAAPETPIDLVVSTGPDAIEMPDLSGMPERTAIFTLSQAGFEVTEDNLTVVEEYSTRFEEGSVIRTEPDAGDLLAREGSVTIYLSLGPAVVPDLTGRSVSDARAALEDIDLVLEVDPDPIEVPSGSGLDGVIAAQDPDPGAELDPGDVVSVRIGEVRQVTVPGVFGLTQQEAAAALNAVGLQLQVGGTLPADPELVGTVVAQDPTQGAQVDEGTTVVVILGEARTVILPDLKGLTEEAARQQLAELNLEMEVTGTLEVGAENVGLVRQQDPAPGVEVTEGSIVGVIIGIEQTTTTTSSTTTTTTSTTTTSTTTTTTPTTTTTTTSTTTTTTAP